MLSSVVLQICFQAALSAFPCAEALALAEIESSLNYKAIGALKEVGLWQQRPEYWGNIPTKSLTMQIKKGIIDLKYVRYHCYPMLGAGWAACWNIGITKAKGLKTKIRKVDGPYVWKYKQAVAKWNSILKQKTFLIAWDDFNYGENRLRGEYN